MQARHFNDIVTASRERKGENDNSAPEGYVRNPRFEETMQRYNRYIEAARDIWECFTGSRIVRAKKRLEASEKKRPFVVSQSCRKNVPSQQSQQAIASPVFT